MDIVDSCPEYITEFINTNVNKLVEIYNRESSNLDNPLLCLNCSKQNNKIDIYCWEMDGLLDKEQKQGLQSLYNNKKFILVKDVDLRSTFMIPIHIN